MGSVSLAAFQNDWYKPGRSRLVQALWFLFGLPLLRSSLVPFSFVRRAVLSLFGAKVGLGVVIKPGVRVKYPWQLEIGDNCWIGEDCWIDNLTYVRIGSNVCLSQGVYLCTGNHDWSDPAFGLIVKPIVIGAGAWVGAKAILCPGAEIGEYSVVTAGSIIAKSVPEWEIHGGNPAALIRKRELRTDSNHLLELLKPSK